MPPAIPQCLFERVDAAVSVLSKAKYEVGMSIQDLQKHKENNGEDGDVSSTPVGLCETQTRPNKYQHTMPPKKPDQHNQELVIGWTRGPKPKCYLTRMKVKLQAKA